MKKFKRVLLGLVLSLSIGTISVGTGFVQASGIDFSEPDIQDSVREGDGITKEFTCVQETGYIEKNLEYRATYVPNQLGGALTPTSTGFKVTFTNIGVDAISKVTFTLKLYNYAGGFISSKTDTLRNLKPGNTVYTWTIAKSDSVFETIYLTGTGSDGGETFIINANTERWNFAGGRYGSMKAMGGQRHHMPSSDALTKTGVLSKNDGAAVRMISSDHYQTSSYGNTETAKEFRAKEIKQINNGKFLAAQKLGISDVQEKFGVKYDKAINEMVTYTKGLSVAK